MELGPFVFLLFQVFFFFGGGGGWGEVHLIYYHNMNVILHSILILELKLYS